MAALAAGKVVSRESLDLLWADAVPTSHDFSGRGFFISRTARGERFVWTRGTEDYGHNGVVKCVFARPGVHPGARARAAPSPSRSGGWNGTTAYTAAVHLAEQPAGEGLRRQLHAANHRMRCAPR